MTKKLIKYLSLVFFICMLSSFSFAQEIQLDICKDEKIGVKFLCNLDWEMETNEGAMLVIISEDPAVTMTVSKSGSPVLFLEQLNDRTIQAIGNYKEDFKTEKVLVANKQAMKVEGFSKGYDEIRLLDYYFVFDNAPFGILFSVNPKGEWDSYRPLFEKIVESVDFIKPAQ